jgi:hypothetical protein
MMIPDGRAVFFLFAALATCACSSSSPKGTPGAPSDVPLDDAGSTDLPPDARAAPVDTSGGGDASAGGVDSAGGDTFGEQVSIDFDGLAKGDTVTTQFPAAVFSSDPGKFVTVQAYPLPGISAPNYICPATSPAFCVESASIDIAFPKPVAHLRFRAIGVQDDRFGSVAVTHDGGNALVPMQKLTSDEYADIDLSAYSGVTRVVIANTDPAGIGLDNLAFDVSP